MACYDLSEAEWRLVEPLLPAVGKGKWREDDHRIINRIFYVLRTGSPWRDLVWSKNRSAKKHECGKPT